MPLTTRGQSPPEKEKSRTSRQSMPRRPAIHAPYSTWYLSTASVSHMAHIYLTTLPAPCQPEISGATIICIKRQFYLLLSIYIVLLRAEQKMQGALFKARLQICAHSLSGQESRCRAVVHIGMQSKRAGHLQPAQQNAGDDPGIYGLLHFLNRRRIRITATGNTGMALMV